MAKVLRSALTGLAQTMMTAREFPDCHLDPGIESCDRLLVEMQTLLHQTPETTAPAGPATLTLTEETEPTAPTSTVAPPAAAAEKMNGLQNLSQKLQADANLRTEVGAISLSGVADAALWTQMQILLLRAPERMASSWRDQMEQAVGTRCNLQLDALDVLPGERDEVVYPALGDPFESRGLRLSPKGPLDKCLGDAPLPCTAAALAPVLTVALWYLDADPVLQHAYRTVYRFGVESLQAPRTREKYRRALLDGWRQLVDAERGGNPVDVFRAWLDVDEAIHSLLHQPPAAGSSWWARQQRRFRDTLPGVKERVIAAGHTLHVQALAGRYAEIRQFTRPDEDREATGNVSAGDVVACLRLYAKLDGAVLPGRVLFRRMR